MSWINAFFEWLGSFFVTEDKPDSEQVAAIQAAAVTACAFLPTVETVLGLIAINPTISTVSAISSQICHAVSNRAQVQGIMSQPPGQPVTVGQVNGVPISGVFIK